MKTNKLTTLSSEIQYSKYVWRQKERSANLVFGTPTSIAVLQKEKRNNSFLPERSFPPMTHFFEEKKLPLGSIKKPRVPLLSLCHSQGSDVPSVNAPPTLGGDCYSCETRCLFFFVLIRRRKNKTATRGRLSPPHFFIRRFLVTSLASRAYSFTKKGSYLFLQSWINSPFFFLLPSAVTLRCVFLAIF